MQYTMPKYKKNLKVDNFFIYSYKTQVAEIDHIKKTITILEYWTKITTKHINYVAKEYGYEVVNEYN